MLSADVTFLCEYGDGSGVWVAGARHAGEKLHEAVKAKLTEQRKFVLWWDGQEKRRATPGNLGPSQTNDAPAAQDFGLDRDTIHRWRRRLKTPNKFAEALEAAHERCVKVCEARQGRTTAYRTMQGRIRSRMPIVLPLSAIGRSHLGNPE